MIFKPNVEFKFKPSKEALYEWAFLIAILIGATIASFGSLFWGAVIGFVLLACIGIFLFLTSKGQ